MQDSTFLRLSVASSLLAICVMSLPVWAQDDDAKPADAVEAPPAAAEKVVDPAENISLSDRQVALRARFGQFEASLGQMARYLQETDPERADLLRRAIGRSQSEQVQERMQEVVRLLAESEGIQYGEAINRQDDLIVAMKGLLELLRSEDRRDEIKAEQERIEELIKDLKRVIGVEKDVRAATERGGDPDDLADRQEKAAAQVDRLLEKIRNQDATKNGDPSEAGEGKDGKPGEGKDGKPGEGKDGKPGEGKDGKPGEGKDGKPGEGKDGKPGEGKDGKPGEGKDGKPGEGKDGKPGEGKDGKPGEGKDGKPGEGKDGKPGEGKPGEGKPGEGKDGKPGEGKPGEGKPGEGKPGEGKPGEGKPGEGKPGESGEQSPKPESMKKEYRTPGRDKIEEAREDLERAIEELRRKQLDPASDNQDEAIAKLQAAKEELEEILKQLREEEREMQLRALEARFQHMLKLQKEVYTGTVSVAQVDPDDWTSTHTARINDMFRKENDIVREADQALQLLKEEGSSVAFPEAMLSIRTDMKTVARRLNDQKVDDVTQLVEQDIIEALSEMVEALKAELDKMQQKKQQQQRQQEGEPSDPDLVNKIAELKMLRSMQKRVNRRTKLIGTKVEGEQAGDADLIGQLEELSARQARIEEATYDLATGKNK